MRSVAGFQEAEAKYRWKDPPWARGSQKAIGWHGGHSKNNCDWADILWAQPRLKQTLNQNMRPYESVLFECIGGNIARQKLQQEAPDSPSESSSSGICLSFLSYWIYSTSSSARGGGGSFKNRRSYRRDLLLESRMTKQKHSITVQLSNWLADSLSNWLIIWLTNGRTDQLTDWLADWLTDWLTNWLTDWLTK